MILIINRSKRDAESLASAFRYMGIVARAVLPERAAAEISPMYRAVIIAAPERLPDEKEYINRLRSYLSSTTMVSLSDTGDLKKVGYDLVAPRASTAAHLYRIIRAHLIATGERPIGEYMMAGIDASVDIGAVTYFSTPLPLTRTESLILRFLIRAYPLPMSPKEILKYAFSQTKLPEAMGIRTHVCAINRKFKSQLGRNLIMSIDGGYVVMTPMLAREKSIDLLSAAN